MGDLCSQINHRLIWPWAADASLLKLTPIFACWFCVTPLIMYLPCFNLLLQCMSHCAQTAVAHQVIQIAMSVQLQLCLHPLSEKQKLESSIHLAWFPLALLIWSAMISIHLHIPVQWELEPISQGKRGTVYTAGLTYRQTLSRSHWADKNLWRFTLTEIKASLYRLHALPQALWEATDWNFHRKTDHWPPILRKHQSAKRSFSLWTTLSPLHTCTNMHTYTHSFLGGVRGPYCASQRKCRHSRGQAIHWSEYRLLHFSASLPC